MWLIQTHDAMLTRKLIAIIFLKAIFWCTKEQVRLRTPGEDKPSRALPPLL